MVSDPWRNWLRSNRDAVRKARKQSKAFVTGLSLSVVPLTHGTKHFMPGNETSGEFANWDDFDALPAINWAARIPPFTTQHSFADVDIDIKPVDGEWSPAREHYVATLLHSILDVVAAVGEIDDRYRWGRHSMGSDGHLWVTVACDKNGRKRLDALTMRQPVVLGDYKVRIEVRTSPDPRVSERKKAITLPGAIYTDRGEHDLLEWRLQLPLDDVPVALPVLPPIQLTQLVRGLWAGLLLAALAPHWGSGARHELALEVSGVLAREVMTEGDDQLIHESHATALMTKLCDAFGDDELPDRLRALEASLISARAGRPVTGYSRLAETIGDPARQALLRLRGGADPDAFASLREKVAYAPYALGHTDVYLDLEQVNLKSIICSKDAIVRHYHPRVEYPSLMNGIRQTKMIDMLLQSRQLQRYREAIDLPGVPFGMVLVDDYTTFRPATDVEIADPTMPKTINIGRGFATAEIEKPDTAAWNRWQMLWARHLHPVCGGSKHAIEDVNRMIAWAVQWPIDKVPRGMCFTGDGGIGKSAIFDLILKPILGEHLIAKVNALNLEGQFRLDNLEGKKFYCIEEINLANANVSIKELLKDLMKNDRIRVNRKYAAQSDVHNFAFPVFLTNEPEPMLTIRGQPERSLVIVQGDTRERLGQTKDEWQRYKDEIARNVVEFIAALKDQNLREAAMYFFMSYEVERAHFNDNTRSASGDPRLQLDPLDEALVDIFENDCISQRFRDVPLTKPFKIEWLKDALEEQLRSRNASRYKLTKHKITTRLKEILGEDGFQDLKFRHDNGKTYRLKYFALNYGSLLHKASATLGLDLIPAYDLDQQRDFGPNLPSTEEARIAWNINFTSY